MYYSVLLNHARPNQTIPGNAHNNLRYTVLLCTTVDCSKPVNTDQKSNPVVFGGGVVYLSDYRTTPV